jgi:hypothetical protein
VINRRKRKVSNPRSTKEEFDSLICKLALLKSELKSAQRLLEAPTKKPGWRKRLWTRGVSMAAALVLVCVFVVVAWGQTMFWFGNDYIKGDEIFQLGYIAGVSDTMAFLAYKGEGGGSVILFNNRTKGMTLGQVHAIVGKYMKDNPQLWHFSMSNLVFNAMIEAGSK